MTRILRRSDYPTHVPSLYPPPEIYPALAWQKKKKKTHLNPHPFSQMLLPNLLH